MASGCHEGLDLAGHDGLFAYSLLMDRTCLIVGCGYVGRRLARRMQAGWHVAGAVRSAATARELSAAGVEAIAFDLDSEPVTDALRRLVDRSVLAWLAPPPDTGTTDLRLERFFAELGDARPTALLYMSTTGVYGDAAGGTVTEDSPARPANDRSRRRLAAERRSVTWCARSGVRCVILRVPAIYGPHRLPLERLRRGEPALRPEESGPGNRIHVDDLVSACAAALEQPVHGVFNVGDGDHSSTTVFLQRTAALAGLQQPRLVSMDAARRLLTPGMLSFLVESRRVDAHRMRETLLPVLAYPTLDAGIAASLAEMAVTS